jgi:hypothetical protein
LGKAQQKARHKHAKGKVYEPRPLCPNRGKIGQMPTGLAPTGAALLLEVSEPLALQQ